MNGGPEQPQSQSQSQPQYLPMHKSNFYEGVIASQNPVGENPADTDLSTEGSEDNSPLPDGEYNFNEES